MKEVVVDIWGDFACFTMSDSKVERVTYPVITPSAARNILEAIYFKPVEFWYEVTKIEVMKPVKYIDIRKNEVYLKSTDKQKKEPIYVEDVHTQRGTTYLMDVYYRIHANIHKRIDCDNPKINDESLYAQFMQRMTKGKCFQQPYLGTRECMCFFAPPCADMKPIEESIELGIMLYDIFDITDNTVLNTDRKYKSGGIKPSYFKPVMRNGVINVPAWGSKEIYV